MVAAPPAAALIYWSDGSVIKRATTGGTGAHTFITGTDAACGLAVDGGHVYWANRPGWVGRAKLDGSMVDQFFLDTQPEACGVAVNASHVFWAADGGIGRAKLDGSGANHAFILPGPSFICGVAVNSTRIFWANESSGQIGRANLDGSLVNHNFVAGVGIPCGVAANNTHVYWANQSFDRIGRAAVSGLDVVQALVQNSLNALPCGVALDASNVFWTNALGDSVGRAGLDGAAANENLIQSGASCGVAVDALGIPATGFILGKLKPNAKKGSATLTLDALWPGKFIASGKGAKKTSKTATGIGPVKLQIKAAGKAAKKLKRRGKLGLKLTITHFPEGGAKASQKKKAKLVKRQ